MECRDVREIADSFLARERNDSTSVSRRGLKKERSPGPFLREATRLSRASLPFFLTRATPQREGKSRQALSRDLGAAVCTLAVRTAGEPG
jgi:hypothetical protein